MITMGKKFKKSMAMAMATAMALSVPVLPVYQTEKVEAKEQKVAESTSALDVEVNEEEENAVINFKGDVSDGEKYPTLYYAVTTMEKDGKTVKWPKASSYEAVEFDGGKTIDLSWVNRKKEQVLCVSTGTSIEEIKPATVVLKAQDTLTATYSGALESGKKKEYNMVGNTDEGYLTFTVGAKKDAKPVSASAIQYRTTNGMYWQEVALGDEDNLQLDYYSAKGATLQMRIAPNSETNTPAGKIVNVKLKAKGKVPGIKVNYNDKSIAVPAKVEYSLDQGGTWKDAAADTKKVTAYFEDYQWDGSENKTVYFRTKGDSKKAPSKIKYQTIKAEDKEFAELQAPVSGSAVADVALPTAGSGKIDVRYKKAYDNTSGLVFTNATDNIYQVAYIERAKLNDGKDLNYITEDGDSLIAASSSAIVAKSKKVVKWVSISAQTRDKTTKQPTKVGTGSFSFPKNADLSKYVLLYRICDKKGESINSETRIFDVPGTVVQTLELLDAKKEVVETVNIASGAATAEVDKTVTLTVSAGGITASNAKYTVAAYTDEKCTSKDTKTFDLKYQSGTLKITSKKDAAANTYYVKVSVEGTSAVLKVVVK